MIGLSLGQSFDVSYFQYLFGVASMSSDQCCTGLRRRAPLTTIFMQFGGPEGYN
jgi:hypothetical protein